ncbi:hypothetical protein Zmor_015360 [Zophobas morio]|uniref:Sialin n=1 Tax=Zophobas morio TaxID=2755281 RepID=A0AA38MH52_9CUCU|nr:hypothetical protein Zmor_015360 [Zophobas morio]
MVYPEEKGLSVPKITTQELRGDTIKSENIPVWKFWKKRRYVVAILAFFGFFNVYALRANLSIAVVAMTTNQTSTLNNRTIISEPEFDWNSKIQGYILSSFFYGYITTQIFGGWLAAKIGGKEVFGIGIAITGVLTLITPWAARTNVYVLLAVRIIEGVFEGVTYPCIHAMWSKWAPPLERTKMTTIAFSGSYVGTVVSMPASAYLATTLGWPSIFYVFGVVSLIWFVFWWVLVTEAPADDPRISKNELEYIGASLGYLPAKQNIKHPWKEILTSLPVWAIIVSHFTDTWAFYTLLTQLPIFLKDMFKYDLEETGFLTALPYLAMAIMIQFFGFVADWLRIKNFLTTTQVRKIFNCTAFAFQAVFMLIIAFSMSSSGTMVCLILGAGIGVSSWSGFGVNFLDIAPQHASVIMGLSNTISTLAGIISPILSGYIVATPRPEEWQTIFCIASGIFVFGSVVYGVFASGEEQPWATKKEIKEEVPLTVIASNR